MAEQVEVGFERSTVVVPLSALLPLKTVPDEIRQSIKFKQIARSVSEVGVIEPLVVARSKDQKGKYQLLDGHMSHAVLTDIAATEARCMIAADDEAYTYNKRINRLATVQEHFTPRRQTRRLRATRPNSSNS
ncbi:MAG: ParB N-terminal domain-containing protein [Vicinamibacteraceae bacterium]